MSLAAGWAVADPGSLCCAIALATEFPRSGFGNAIKTACRIIANPAGVAAVRVTLSGFDTHANQQTWNATKLKS